MAKVKKKTVKQGRSVAKGEDGLAFGRRNYVLFGAGLFAILLGYFLLSRSSITLAPLLLVAGYCVIIPLAIALK